MANTLNLGNGNWATKEDSLLAYNSENGNFKPLPFDFTRASNATVVNKDGLIETVGSGEPRIDFSNDAKGALLLEPQRSNLVTYSEAFENSFWSKFGTSFSVTDNDSISPDGTLNASTLNVSNTDNTLYNATSFSATNASWTFSVYAKGSGSFDMNIRLPGNAATTQTMTLTSDWQRFYVTSVSGTSITSVESFLVLNNIVNMDIFGAQLEQGSYATSYIPTSGSAVTRIAETSSQTVPSGIIGQTEGVLYGEVKYLSNNIGAGVYAPMSLIEGNNFVTFRHQGGTSNKLVIFIYVNNIEKFVFATTVYDLNNYVKIAVLYSSSGSKVFINGTVAYTDTINSSFPSNSLTKIEGFQGGDYFGGNVKDLRVYNTTLTDAELQALTTI